MDADSWPLWLLLFLCIIASAFFSASEMAHVAANKIRIRNSAENGDSRAKRALYVSQHFEQLITTILIGNNIANIGCASIATVLFTRLFGAAGVAYATVATTVVIFFLGEMIPKTVAKRNSEMIACYTAAPLIALMRVLKPIAYLFNRWSAWIKQKFPSPDEPSFTEDELHDIIETIEDEGVLEPEQQELVQSAFDFAALTARDILIPMDQVISLDAQASNEEILSAIKGHKYSRYPVFDKRHGRALGVLPVNSFLTARLQGDMRPIRPLLTPLGSYRADLHIDDLMQAMNQRRSHMALICDEKGAPLGIVTMEDILEELVGDIYDEDDMIGEVQPS